MRLTSLIVLAVVVLGIGYVLVFKRDWLFQKAEEGKRALEGYKAAETPAQAMDLFLKAVKARDYKTAATYCTSDYKEQLEKGHTAARTLGDYIDKLNAYMKNKGLKTDMSVFLLYKLDLFPSQFKVKEAPKKIDDNTAVGEFVLEQEILDAPAVDVKGVAGRMDIKMFSNALGGALGSCLFPKGPIGQVKLVRAGTDEKKSWKLQVPLLPGQTQLVNHYIDKYPTYETGFKRLWGEVNNNRYSSPKEFEGEIIDVLIKANPK